MVYTVSPQEFLTHCTVRIECDLGKNGISTGTGFFFGFDHEDKTYVPAIVTNKHVVQGAKHGKFVLTEKGKNDEPLLGKVIEIKVDNFEGRWIRHPDPNVDLCVLPIATLHKQADLLSKSFFYTTVLDANIPTEGEWNKLEALEEIVMVGYPIGLWDSHNNMPILRRGVTATNCKLNYEGRSEFVIDTACFPGSSGSPVFLFNFGVIPSKTGGFAVGSRIKLIGILYAGPQYGAHGELFSVPIPTQMQQMVHTPIPTNLGFAIRSTNLSAFTDLFRRSKVAAGNPTA